jgi:hypothetical protein
MGLWNRIFQRIDPADMPEAHYFGRFSDAYKSAIRYAHWDKAMRLFDLDNYRETLLEFLYYIQNDEADNVFFDEHDRNFNFQIIQGSKKLSGEIIDGRIIVKAPLVSGVSYSTGLLRRLLEKNYNLKYCRYALDDEHQLTVIFETFMKDANPYKLYFGIKELAIHADKMDDLILSEFEQLKPYEVGHTRAVSEKIKTIKTNLFFSKLNLLKNELESGYLKKARDPNDLIYAILSTFYELDFLLAPHGKSTEIIERAHQEYFGDGTRPVELKIASLVEALNLLLYLPADDLGKEWYEVIYTFGINSPVDLYQAQSNIRTEISKIDWYVDNNQFDEAQAIIKFIIGYILFDYSVDHLLKGLLTIYFRILNESYFEQLGYESKFIDKKGYLHSKRIEAMIHQLLHRYDDQFHGINIPIEQLNYQSMYHFGQSLLHLILNSSFIPIEQGR